MSILNFKPFYIHGVRNRRRRDSHHLRSQPHGFTMLITPSNEDRCVNIQVALCHYDDEFSRREGRSSANMSEVKTINARELSHELVKLRGKIWGTNPANFQGMYDYTLRYIV